MVYQILLFLFTAFFMQFKLINATSGGSTDDVLVRAMFQAIEFLETDESTGIDTVNLLRCLYYQGLPGACLVGVLNYGLLTIVCDSTLADKECVVKIAACCYKIMESDLFFGSQYNIDDIDDLNNIYTLDASLDRASVARYNGVLRNMPIEPTNSSHLSASMATATPIEQDPVKICKPPLYHIFKVTQGSYRNRNKDY